MSWEVVIKDTDGNFAQIPFAELPRGGTYAIGLKSDALTDAELNITYNYGSYFRIVWEDGLERLDGIPLTEAIPLLESAIQVLGTQRDDDYWLATQGNAGAALNDLLTLCRKINKPHLYKVEVE